LPQLRPRNLLPPWLLNIIDNWASEYIKRRIIHALQDGLSEELFTFTGATARLCAPAWQSLTCLSAIHARRRSGPVSLALICSVLRTTQPDSCACSEHD
jgi:hypothetical protein